MGRQNLIKRSNKRQGTSFNIISYVDNKEVFLNTEYGYFELNTQATKPFVAAYFIKAFIDYDTYVNSGDLLQLKDGRRLLITVKNPEIFRNKIIRYMCICYKCNSIVSIKRKTNTITNPITYEEEDVFTDIAKNIDCLLTEGDFRSEITDNVYGKDEESKKEFYLQGSYNAELGDKVETENGDMYIKQIKRSYFDGIDFCIVSYDK